MEIFPNEKQSCSSVMLGFTWSFSIVSESSAADFSPEEADEFCIEYLYNLW